LAADFVFAIVIKKVMDLHARQRIAIVNSEGFPVWIHALARKQRIRARTETLQSLVQFSFAFCR
jgi:hypothetical protein